jgi:uncharacterized membrane protein YsdA (DUF1294 family)
MFEWLIVIIGIILGTYILSVVMPFILPILRAIFELAFSAIDIFIKILLNVLIIFLLTQAAVWFGLYPLLKGHLNWLVFSMSQLVMVTAVIIISTLFLIITFGKSPPFRTYGVLAIIINNLIPITIISYIYSLSKNSGTSFQIPNLHSKEISFILSLYLTSINISTYSVYGYDKFRAWLFPKEEDREGSKSPRLNHAAQEIAHWIEQFVPWVKTARVPEWILHWHSIFGGTLGACFAQQAFNHKTKKQPFQAVHRTILVTQIFLLIVTFVLAKGN